MRKTPRDKSRRSTDSILYDKVIPILLIGMAVLTVVFILIAAGILLGFVPFK